MADLENDQRRTGAGDAFINVPVRRPRRRESGWRRILKDVARGLGAALLLAAGTIYTLRQTNPKFARPGEMLRLPPALITAQKPGTERYMISDEKTKEEVARVKLVLLRHTKDTARAQHIAEAMVLEGRKKNISPSLLIGVLLTEAADLNPRSRSFVGARGLMQIMPFHAGEWKKECGDGTDLYDITTNICHGVAILASYMKRSPNIEKALLRYNGCVRGTNTPHCHTYSGKVLRYAERAASQMFNPSLSGSD
ncbi:MAG TPA: transglycosylase SLT domain-containing protein [Gemmatimonadaceae bacterium]|nr:transglycosylase SLT domain-containing protein [Gemmatimonadaceae bacterium]